MTTETNIKQHKNKREDTHLIFFSILSDILAEYTIHGDNILSKEGKMSDSEIMNGIPNFREHTSFFQNNENKFLNIITQPRFEGGWKNKLTLKERSFVATEFWCRNFLRVHKFIIDEVQPDLNHTYFFDDNKKIIQRCFEVRNSRNSFDVDFATKHTSRFARSILNEQHIINALSSMLFESGKLPETVIFSRIHKTSYYDSKKNFLYISDRYNGFYPITEKGVLTRCDNGTDNIFFEYYKDVISEEPGWSEKIWLEEIKEKDINKMRDFRDFLKEYSFDESEGISSNEYIDFVYCNLLTTFFNPADRPIIKVVGEHGSGKSYLMNNCVQFVTHSRLTKTKILQDNPESLEVVASANRVVPWDNVTKLTTEMIESMNVISTGGTASKRKLFTTHSLASFDISAFLWYTTTEEDLGFWRRDLVDRMIHIFVDKKWDESTKKEKFNSSMISIFYDKQRYLEFFAMMFHHLSIMLKHINNTKPFAKTRLDDWSRLMKCASKAIGKSKKYMENIIEKEIKIKNSMMAERDKTIEPLIQAFGKGKLILGQQYRSSEVLDVLEEIDYKITQGKYGTSSQGLARMFRKKADMYLDLGFKIERTQKKVNGVYRWVFTHTVHGTNQEEYQNDYAFFEYK